MSLVDIIQIVIGVLSLIATIVVSFLIYWLQTRHEKEIRKIEENQKHRELEEKAEGFLIDNVDEIEFLSNCIIAANVHRREKHTREIYNSFCRCSLELQNEILKQAGFTISMITDKDWDDLCFDRLINDMAKYQLGRDVLYDGAKYFHRGFERYRDAIFDIEYNRIIKPIYSSTAHEFYRDGLIDIGTYIDHYFDYILGDRKIAVESDMVYPPIDYVWESQNLGSCEEVLVCKWIILLVKDIVINIHNRFQNKEIYDTWNENLPTAASDTLEDEYYKVMYWMYVTYYVPTLEKDNKKQKGRGKQCQSTKTH